MLKSRSRSSVFALVALACLFVIARNLYRRHLQQELGAAIADDDGEAVSALLRRGAKDEGRSYLFAAAQDGKVAVARALLDNERGVNAPIRGRLPLVQAVSMRQMEMVRLLLEKGADPNLTDETGNKPLTTAMQTIRNDPRHDPIVQMLLAHGARPTSRQAYLLAPVQASAQAVIAAKGEKTAQYSPASETHPDAKMLLDAVQMGQTDVVGRLMQQEADVNAPAPQHGTPLCLAAVCGHVETLRYMLDHAPHPNTGAALKAAAGYGSVETTRLLLLPRYRPTPAQISMALLEAYHDRPIFLHPSAVYSTAHFVKTAQNFQTVIALLLQQPAHWNARDAQGQTPLMLAAQNGEADIVKSLLDKSAEVNCADNQGMTALLWAAETGRADCVRLLLAHHADVNAKNRQGGTALMAAVWKGSADIARLLLDSGADVNAGNGNGSALIGAVRTGNRNAVELLLAKGARVSATNRQGKTALDYAVKLHRTDIAFLLQKPEFAGSGLR